VYWFKNFHLVYCSAFVWSFDKIMQWILLQLLQTCSLSNLVSRCIWFSAMLHHILTIAHFLMTTKMPVLFKIWYKISLWQRRCIHVSCKFQDSGFTTPSYRFKWNFVLVHWFFTNLWPLDAEKYHESLVKYPYRREPWSVCLHSASSFPDFSLYRTKIFT
jgi:hypothetical protein